MHRRTETVSAEFDRMLKKYEELVDVLQTSNAVKLMLLDVTTAVVGRRRIRVPPRFHMAAEGMRKSYKAVGKATVIVSIIISGIRIGKAILDECGIDSEIEAWESIIRCLKEDLNDCKGKNAERLQKSLKFAREMLEKARDCKRNPGKKSCLTTLCVGAEWSGSAAVGLAGAKTGAAIGLIGGPIGSMVGAATGGMLGAIVGSEFGTSAVQNFRVTEDGLATEMEGSVAKLDKGFLLPCEGSVLPCDANFFLGKGVEVGARASVVSLGRGDASCDFGKIGGSIGFSNKGVDVGVEGKFAWTQLGDLGVGFQVDTGVEFSSNKASIKFLGLGVSIGNNGIELSTPFVSVKKK